jgi:ribonuclease HIII
MKENVTLKITEEEKNQIVAYYTPYQVENNGEYIIFAAKKDDVSLIIYQSKKGYSALFNGENALLQARIFSLDAKLNQPKITQEITWEYLDNQIGSDEVGTGDFFGPIIVVAAYVRKDQISLLKELGINDSKKLTDQKILEIVPQIINQVIYSQLTCLPTKYNMMQEKGYNMNAIKAILHNQALSNVRKKINNENTYCFIDQFCSPSSYYGYLKEYTTLTNNIFFHTKGESYYPSVALASMIARYSFLKYFEELKELYHLDFPFGSGKKVNEFSIDLINKIGIDVFATLVKINFANYQEIIQSVDNLK